MQNKDVKEYLSEQKYRELKDELFRLRTVRRKEIAEELENARSLGDLSENAEYHEAQEAQVNLEERIAKIESILKRAVIIENRRGSIADLGSTVLIKKDGDNEEKKWEIVGSEEADFAKGKISNMSPVGRAIIGKSKGEKFVVATPRGQVAYTIVDIV